MKPVFESWKDQIEILPPREAEFERWLFVSVAGVLFAEKCGELITVRADRFALSKQQRLKRIMTLSRSWHFSCRRLLQQPASLKLLVFDRGRVRRQLARVPSWIFSQLRYPGEVSVAGFLHELGRRWRESGRIPHEIGLVLGYPLKDVLGFMGLLPLRYEGGCGWRIYGNPCRSLRRSQRYRVARERAIAFLEQ